MRDIIKGLIDKFEKNESKYLDSDYNETECRLEFLDVFFECFGWDVHNKKNLDPLKKEVDVEKVTKNKKKPDYSFKYFSYSKFFVEAKKPSVDINIKNEPAFQARRYGWNAKHPLVVLTNFRDLYIYDCNYMPKATDDLRVCLIKHYNYRDYYDKYDEIASYIGRDLVYSGAFDSNFKKLSDLEHTYFNVDSAFLAEINSWRVSLANDLYNNDATKFSDMNYLNDVIQNFINRLVFLRICEDRNLSTYTELCNTIQDTAKLKDELSILFKESDKQYNSGLFKGNDILFDLNNDLVLNIIKRLYFPESPYLFNIIKTNILGEIYEMFLTEKLSVEDGKIILIKKEECMFKSVVTTPVEIVDNIVENLVESKLNGKNYIEIFRLKIVDIACGSGIFLEEAFEKLCNLCKKILLSTAPDELEHTENGELKLKYSHKKRLLTSCIFGVDIDYQATEVCKFSLLIKLLEGETNESVIDERPILPNLDDNIVCGNSLISPSDIRRAKTSEIIKINAYDWKSINNGEKFDIIIGNPPYVNTEDLHSISLEREMDVYKKVYASAYKQFDKYYLFIEKAINLVKDDGCIGMIVPNKFMKIDAAKMLRGYLLEKIKEIGIIDFGSNQLFDDKTIYSLILTLKKSGKKEMNYKKCDSLEKLVSSDFHSNVVIDSDRFSDGLWIISDLYYKTNDSNNFISLNEVANVFNGIQTSMERPHVYMIEKEQIISETLDTITFKFEGKKFMVEKSILRRYFKPTKQSEKGKGSYDLIDTDKYIIYPYSLDGKLYDIETMKNDYPNCFKYLKHFYSYLVPKQVSRKGRRDVPNSNKNTWYQYGRTQNLTAFNNVKKLIVKNLFDKPMFAYDDTDMILASGGTAGYSAVSCLETAEFKYSLEFIQAWLASDITVSIFKDIASPFEGGFYAIGTAKLNLIKIAKLDFNNVVDKRDHNVVTNYVKEIRKLKNDILKLSRKKEIDAMNKQIDELIRLVNSRITSIYERKLK